MGDPRISTTGEVVTQFQAEREGCSNIPPSNKDLNDFVKLLDIRSPPFNVF